MPQQRSIYYQSSSLRRKKMPTQRFSRILNISLSHSIAPFAKSLKRTKVLLIVAVLALAGLAILTTVSSAATPSSGTITPTSGALTYTAGPFLVANESGQGGVVTPVCQPGTPLCDEYTLTVNASSVAANKKLLIQVQWPTTTADFDLYILQGSNIVGVPTARATQRQCFSTYLPMALLIQF